MPLRIVETNQSDLKNIVAEQGAIRAGATINPKSRAGDHNRKGYSGTMYVAKTSNMYSAENKLFRTAEAEKGLTPRHNKHKQSNVQADPGYTYVIKGKKYG